MDLGRRSESESSRNILNLPVLQTSVQYITFNTNSLEFGRQPSPIAHQQSPTSHANMNILSDCLLSWPCHATKKWTPTKNFPTKITGKALLLNGNFTLKYAIFLRFSCRFTANRFGTVQVHRLVSERRNVLVCFSHGKKLLSESQFVGWLAEWLWINSATFNFPIDQLLSSSSSPLVI